MAELTAEEWLDLIEFYNEGHTMLECAAIYGVSNATISRYFKKNGIPPRRAFAPSRREKVAKMINNEDSLIPEEWLKEFNKTPKRSLRSPPPPVRKIIKLSEDESTHYEKEI